MAKKQPPMDDKVTAQQTGEQANPVASDSSSVSVNQNISNSESTNILTKPTVEQTAAPVEGEKKETPLFDPTKLEEGEPLAGIGDAPAMPPREAGGVDAESRGRGAPRKYATPEEAKAAKQKRDHDRRAKQNGNTVSSPTSAATSIDTGSAKKIQADAGANVINAALDMVCKIVSGGEYVPDPTIDTAFKAATSEYLIATGGTVPPWALVLILGAAKVLPATSTPTARGRLSGVWSKLRGWWIAKRG